MSGESPSLSFSSCQILTIFSFSVSVKRSMIKEYKKMKEEHDNSLTDQQQKTQDNLRHRLHQKAQQGKGAAPKDTSLSLSELTNALNSIDTERILQQVPLKKSPTERWAEDRKGSADEEERSSYLLSQHVKHHSQLVS
jgi:hypothetical protein